MADKTALMQAFADYARTIARPYEIGDVLYRLTDQVVEVLRLDGAGVSLSNSDGALRYVTAADARVAQVEEAQVEAQEGPCHEAHLTGQRVTSSDLEAETRWPSYVKKAVSAGLRAVAGIPMAVDDQRIGALNVYLQRPQEWDAEDLEVAQLLADMATGYIVNARRLIASDRLSSQLQHALDSRIVIEQAKGVLVARAGIGPAEAFHRIRAHARSNNAKVHDVAQAIVDGDLRL